MIFTFLSHEFKAFQRSKNIGKSIAVMIFIGLALLYLFLCVVFIGLFLDKILLSVFPNDLLVVSFCGCLMLYFLIDLILRIQLQELPTLRAQPYLHLRIKRNMIVRYLSMMGMVSVFNLWPFILFTPSLIKIISRQSGSTTALIYLASIVSLAVFNNYLALFIKRKSNLNGWIFLIVTGILIFILLGDFKFHLYSIFHASHFFFGNLADNHALMLIPILMAVGMYYINFVYLKRNLYMDELNQGKASAYKSSTEYPFLNKFGRVGDLAANELKLILRNKRPRSALIMSILFLFIGLVYYTNGQYKQTWYIFTGTFMTGIFIINYGQFMHSWQAAHFDGIMVSKIKISDFIKSKYLLFTLLSSIVFLLTIPYVYFGWNILLINLVMYLWNIGVNTTMVLFFANRNAKRIDLSKSGSLNWEGSSSTQFLLGIPIFITPYLVYIPFNYFNQELIGLGVMAAIGISFILTRNYWIQKLENDFIKKRYTIIEGFRNK
jgi:hypothetical protein